MSQYEDMCDDNNRICPYCKHQYQVEAEDYSEGGQVEECEECGMKFYSHDSFSVTHHSAPDCSLNGQSHQWQSEHIGRGRRHDFCSVCGERRPGEHF